ncbi:MAG: Zn(2+)-responsive transcriptional regulator [Algicola sp.]|nr:Zn(2+)-responsive transcriptional regulator [Algicola sp.]
MMQIGQLAKKLGVKTDTLRFYEKNGLLAPSTRSDSGYRYYSGADHQRALFILRCKKVGFTLADIKELLSIRIDKTSHSCEDVKKRTTAKRLDVEMRIAELERFRDSLIVLEKACCGGPESAEYCSILDALEEKGATNAN